MPFEESAQDEISRFEEQYRKQPESLVFARLADAYRKSGDPQRALEVLEDGILRHPDYLSAHIVRARTFRDLGRTEDARAAFERVIEIDAQNLVAIRGLAEIANETGDPESEITWLERLEAADPQGGDSAARLAELRDQSTAARPAPVAEPDGGEWWNDPPPETLDSEPRMPEETSALPVESEAAGYDPVDEANGEEEDAATTEFTSGPAELVTELWSGPAVEPDLGSVRDPIAEELDAAILDEDSAAHPGAEETSPAPADAWWYEPREATDEGPGQDSGTSDDSEAGDADLLTRTMADLYARQGLIDEAEAIYRELLVDRPDDESLRDGLDAVLGMRAARGARLSTAIDATDTARPADTAESVPIIEPTGTRELEATVEVEEPDQGLEREEPVGDLEGDREADASAGGPLVAEQLIRVLREGEQVADRLPDRPVQRSLLEQWLESLRS
ncbi:MAG: tetratricopeptide repeat protein [marine benthic group bacterium]|nr:tetratricopeptide repeat protein [Gemmatimonadota bacterium]MCL7980428.1 tetratricopeptide repeat protein [Gemmatimonadota bacterium]